MAASAPMGRSITVRASGIEPLTGLVRGAGLEAGLERMIRYAPERGCTVVVLNLDRFGHVNDLIGYGAGDEVLGELGARLRHWAPRGVVAARLGGDEFGVAGQGQEWVEELIGLLEEPVRVEGRELYLTASVGVARYPADGVTAGELLRGAGQARERAKNRGGNTREAAAPPAGPGPEARHRMESALRRALVNEELSLRFQPQVDRDGRLRGMEALVVWKSAELGRVDTEAFVKLAEEIGAIFPIGAWVLRESLRQVAAWRAEGLTVPRVAVNVSALQFGRAEFVEVVRQALLDYEVPGQLLELEITESCLLEDLDACALRMAQLRALGVRIAMDDFGVGYSPLAYLHKLPLDVVKVDRGFVRKLTAPHESSLPLVHTIAVLAHHRGLQVVAEGVETMEELELVQAARCDLVQGYLISNPLEAEALEPYLREPERLAACFRGVRLHY